MHQLASRRAGGHGTLPVLVTERRHVRAAPSGSSATPTATSTPEQRLFTGDPEVERLCRRLDAGLGPDGRRLIYAHMLPRPELMLPYNNQGVPAVGGAGR